jgi:hypothetical protein
MPRSAPIRTRSTNESRPCLAVSPGPDRTATRALGHPDHHADDPPRGPAGSGPGQTPGPPTTRQGRRQHRAPPHSHPRRPTPGHPPPLPPRPAPGRRRDPVPRPTRDDQQAHPRHPQSPGTGRPHHPARPAASGHPGPPLRSREHGRHLPPDRDQDDGLMICEPLVLHPAGRGGSGRLGDRDGRCFGAGRVAVFGPLELPIGHLAFDHTGVGSWPSGRQEPLADLTQRCGQAPGQPGGGKTPLGRRRDGGRLGGCG